MDAAIDSLAVAAFVAPAPESDGTLSASS